MARGRPPKSLIRERIQQIIDALGVTYGYEIFKIYDAAFGPVELRSMYYHLSKGLDLDEFEEVGIKQERGKFTWGDISIRKYYILGPAAVGGATDDLHIIIKTLNLKHRELKNFVDWNSLLKEKTNYLEKEVNSFLKKKSIDKKQAAQLEKNLTNFINWFSKKNIKSLGQLEDLKKKVESVLSS